MTDEEIKKISEGPNYKGRKEYTIRDFSTVFSIVPFDILSFKPGIYPGSFNIPKCLNQNEPQSLVVGISRHLMIIGGKKDPIAIDTPSYMIARAIVKDFLDAQLFTTPEAAPGITFIQGSVSSEQFRTEHKGLHEQMKAMQKNWFFNLIRETDTDWKKTHNLRVASDQAKFAARFLGLEKEWTRDEIVALEWLECPSCLVKNNPKAVVCNNCRCILNQEEYAKLKFAS